ncbi:hypothetical protein EVG20_g10028 [Dentipellis fragilis]|uniref:Uncharacterized protein n=1 Tax=Dentipellis fragilis TaxID=205917 RepID=A0A4Y9XV57_9AGAM|nr:hypothetical protein EVG20_g10028 [Dentipellis fragilis]
MSASPRRAFHACPITTGFGMRPGASQSPAGELIMLVYAAEARNRTKAEAKREDPIRTDEGVAILRNWVDARPPDPGPVGLRTTEPRGAFLHDHAYAEMAISRDRAKEWPEEAVALAEWDSIGGGRDRASQIYDQDCRSAPSWRYMRRLVSEPHLQQSLGHAADGFETPGNIYGTRFFALERQSACAQEIENIGAIIWSGRIPESRKDEHVGRRAFSYTDDRFATTLVTQDWYKAPRKTFEKSSARYVYKGELTDNSTVTFTGQSYNTSIYKLEDLVISDPPVLYKTRVTTRDARLQPSWSDYVYSVPDLSKYPVLQIGLYVF